MRTRTTTCVVALLAAVSGALGCVTRDGAYASFTDIFEPVAFVDAVNTLYHSLGLLHDERIALCADIDADGDVDFVDFVNVLYLQLGTLDVPAHLQRSPPPPAPPMRDGIAWTDVPLPATVGWRALEPGTMCTADASERMSMTLASIDLPEGDWAFRAEVRLPPGGNSGVFYFSVEGFAGIEFQVVDETNADGMVAESTFGALYGYVGPREYPASSARPIGEWNTIEVQRVGSHMLHFLNGDNLLSYDLDKRHLMEHVTQYGPRESVWHSAATVGTIQLQHHGESDVCYRGARFFAASQS